MKLYNPVTYQAPNEELLLYFPLWQGTPNIICLTMAKTLQGIITSYYGKDSPDISSHWVGSTIFDLYVTIIK